MVYNGGYLPQGNELSDAINAGNVLVRSVTTAFSENSLHPGVSYNKAENWYT
jgi:hypothetical protein